MSPSRRYRLACGSLDQGECEVLSAQIDSEIANEYPGRDIVSMSITSRFEYVVGFADGTAVVASLD